MIAAESELLDVGSGLPQAGDVAPNFLFMLPDGSTQQLSDLRGKKVILNFWASWCAPCRAEMPDIQRVVNSTSSDELVVLAVNREEDMETIKQFVNEVGISFPVVVNEEGDISERYGALGLPTTFFINSDGTIHLLKKGIMDEAFIRDRLQEMQ
ncbi:MAG: TlpA family protein disulfide reductase [Chloroflexaceae bacterium]|nr:TlpA family protein disulfide reductase [Chloroflexaceae bacterium]